MTRDEKLKHIRLLAMMNAETLADDEAVRVSSLFEEWQADVSYPKDKRLSYHDKLYKVLQAHTSQADWTPDVTPALFEVIDVTHAGTLEDPIPASRNMTYENGKYYYDSEDDTTYLCNRDTEIPVAYMPHELIGTYFETI